MSDKLQDVFRVKESERANYLRAPAPRLPYPLRLPTQLIVVVAFVWIRNCLSRSCRPFICLHLPISIFAQDHDYDTRRYHPSRTQRQHTCASTCDSIQQLSVRPPDALPWSSWRVGRPLDIALVKIRATLIHE